MNWNQYHRHEEKERRRLVEDPCSIPNCGFSTDCSSRCYQKICENPRNKDACAINGAFGAIGLGLGQLAVGG